MCWLWVRLTHELGYSDALRHGSVEFCTFVHAFTYLFFTDKPLNFGQ